jgi:hypothetical protein
MMAYLPSYSTQFEQQRLPRVILGHQNFRRHRVQAQQLNYNPSAAPPWQQ